MKRILEDLYHDNLTVSGQTFQRGTKYARALNRVTETEDALGQKLTPEDRSLLAEYAMASAGLTSVSLEKRILRAFGQAHGSCWRCLKRKNRKRARMKKMKKKRELLPPAAF